MSMFTLTTLPIMWLCRGCESGLNKWLPTGKRGNYRNTMFLKFHKCRADQPQTVIKQLQTHLELLRASVSLIESVHSLFAFL